MLLFFFRRVTSSNVEILFYQLLLIFFSSCYNCLRCEDEDGISGIIIGEVGCFKTCRSGCIILDDSTFMQMHAECDSPQINFNEYSLLGLTASGGCNVTFTRDVSVIEGEKRYHYRVSVCDCGLCYVEETADNWVLVPKLPSGWTVTFEVDD